jgi:eukaryotic-like serine/threonine-protein kinase
LSDPANSVAPDPRSLQAAPDPDATALSPESATQLSERNLGSIGPYRLLTKLGEGGMGTVWLAEQTSPVKREVAIKVIKSNRLSDSALQRFDLERQALAIMNHPAIAKVFDAGSTSEGRPYFVMEYVSGLPISIYCNQKHLVPRERIQLMVMVCEGVQHAHQKAILHRDLKPSNILITEVDGKPVPRIIDFGIAKATQMTGGDDATRTMFTGGLVGTPGYMSPEQADPGTLDIDTRTDVYSLGVVLYELLTGSLPFNPKQWRNKPLHEVLRQLHEDEPQRPSTRVGTGSTIATTNSGTETGKLVSQLRGDLDWITLKALERERDRRYGSAAELAADLTRYLYDEPVTARPPSVAYRARKFARRNRLAVAFTAVLAVLIIGFAISLIIERNRARREAETSRRVSDFMINMFNVSDPTEAHGNTVTAREILDKSSKNIESGLDKDPQLQAQLMDVMGNVYERLGLYSRAHILLERSAAMRRQVLGPRHPDTLRSMDGLAWLLSREGHLSEAEKLQRQILDARRAVLSAESPDLAMSLDHLASTLGDEGHSNEAEKLDREAFAIATRTLGPSHPLTLGMMTNLGGTLLQEERYSEAETMLRRAVELERVALGVEHPTTLLAMEVLGATLIKTEKYAEAEKLQEETREIQVRVLGPDHPDTAGSTYNLACLAMRQGDHEKALALLRNAVDHGLPFAAGLGMKDDPDLQALHGDARFEALIAEVQKHAQASPKSN